MRKKSVLHSGAALLLLAAAIPGFSQERVSDIAAGSLSSSPTNFQVYNNNIYFLGKYSLAGNGTVDKQEWFRFSPSTGAVQQLTHDHQVVSGSTIFRAPVRIGDNVFVSSSKGTRTNLEFSRFDLATETEQWVELYPGNNGSADYSSDPIVYGEDPATGYVFFNPSTAGGGYQLHYWKPSDNSISRLTSINGSAGIGQNSSAGIVILGDYVYTTASIGGRNSLIQIDKANGSYTLFDAATTGAYNPQYIRNLNGRIYFTARTGSGTGPVNLYCYDPAAGGNPVKLTSYTRTTADGNLSGLFTGSDGNLYVNVTYYNTSPVQGQLMRVDVTTNTITYYDGSNGTAAIPNTYAFTTDDHLYVTELNAGKRYLVKYHLATGERSAVSATPFNSLSGFFKASNTRVYFSGNDGTNGTELWELSPNKDALRMVANLNPGNASSSPLNFTEIAGKLYFSANDGVNGVELFSYNLPQYALPVKLLSFEATANGKTVQLQWKVAAQSAIRSYEIERSADGRAFQAIGSVRSSVGTEGVYSFTDQQPGAHNYYRLRVVEEDGSTSYSAVRLVATGSRNALSVSPNPVTGPTAGIRYAAANGKPAGYTIYTIAGMAVQRGVLQNGYNAIAVEQLKAGKYVVQAATGESVVLEKF